jgi:hypothetical protein
MKLLQEKPLMSHYDHLLHGQSKRSRAKSAAHRLPFSLEDSQLPPIDAYQQERTVPPACFAPAGAEILAYQEIECRTKSKRQPNQVIGRQFIVRPDANCQVCEIRSGTEIGQIAMTAFLTLGSHEDFGGRFRHDAGGGATTRRYFLLHQKATLSVTCNYPGSTWTGYLNTGESGSTVGICMMSSGSRQRTWTLRKVPRREHGSSVEDDQKKWHSSPFHRRRRREPRQKIEKPSVPTCF